VWTIIGCPLCTMRSPYTKAVVQPLARPWIRVINLGGQIRLWGRLDNDVQTHGPGGGGFVIDETRDGASALEESWEGGGVQAEGSFNYLKLYPAKRQSGNILGRQKSSQMPPRGCPCCEADRAVGVRSAYPDMLAAAIRVDEVGRDSAWPGD
jgi:hypothetical protein